MKISIISGSHRKNSQSLKVAQFVQQTLEAGLCDETFLLSLGEDPLPLWDEGVWDGDPQWQERLDPIKQQLADSDGIVVISPEYHGQVPAGLKNFFLLFGKNELGHKPGLIITVSSGDGGSYPVAELRMSSYKNSRICYIPDHVIVRKVESVLNENSEDNDARSDSYYRERLQWSLNILNEYAIALKPVRESGVTDSDKFRNGM
jgi:NAD(P)H-dependent FMN reductase